MQHAKESIIQESINKVAENDRRTQTLDLSGSRVFQAKAAVLAASLADALLSNTRLTALNLSYCNIGTGAIGKARRPRPPRRRRAARATRAAPRARSSPSASRATRRCSTSTCRTTSWTGRG